MAPDTVTPAPEAQAPAAAAPAAAATPPPETTNKTSTGEPAAKGVSAETKVPAATPAATKPPEAAKPSTLLEKKLPPADPAKAAAEAPKGDEKNKVEAEKYEVVLPKESLLGQDHAKSMAAEYQKLGLSKDQAQAMAAHVDGTLKGYVDLQMAKLNETEANWWAELSAHPKYGGEHIEQSNQLATAALDKFFPGLKDELVNSPYAAHPKLFAGLVELGKSIADPKFRTGAPTTPPAEVDAATAMYGADGKGKNVVNKEA